MTLTTSAATIVLNADLGEGFGRVAGTRGRCVKPTGALDNTIVHHEPQAAAVIDAVRRVSAWWSRPTPARSGRWPSAASDAGLATRN